MKIYSAYVYQLLPSKQICKKGNDYIMCNNIPVNSNILKDIIENAAPIAIFYRGVCVAINVDDIGKNVSINRVLDSNDMHIPSGQVSKYELIIKVPFIDRNNGRIMNAKANIIGEYL